MGSSNRVAVFECEKKPAAGSKAMVVTNHPRASAAATEILLGGGNAVDAAVAALFALTVVEPMMVGVLGGGVAHVRLANGEHHIVDGLATAPSAATPDLYRTVSDTLPDYRETVDRENSVGAKAVAVPGSLAAWCQTLADYGTLSLDDVMDPAIRLAHRGFVASPYLADCVLDRADDLASDAGLAALYLPNGEPLKAGEIVRQPDYASTLEMIAAMGPDVLYGGSLGDTVAAALQDRGGIMVAKDLADYQVEVRAPIVGTYRGFEVLGPPPPASAGVHIAQMLNVLEGFDVAAMGFGSADHVHVIAEALKLAFADRAVATADPAFVDVPVDTIIDKNYATSRRELIDMAAARDWTPGIEGYESQSTTHVTVADSDGNVVATTQTINSLFGACVQIPGTGMTANNYMGNFDPHPGMALSIEPGKRVYTSMAPMMVREPGASGRLRFALGLPGGLRIFPSALQALVNLIDHDMTLQEAVEAPRVWTEGGPLELEPAFPDSVADDLAQRGHTIARVPRVAGGMNAIAFDDDGSMVGAACWRADGTPVGVAGGLARPGVRFSAE